MHITFKSIAGQAVELDIEPTMTVRFHLFLFRRFPFGCPSKVDLLLPLL
jgi:hypothetical protein